MKFRIIVSVILIVLLSAGISSIANAAPYRRHCHGWCDPRPFVRVYVPPIVFGGYYGGSFYRPHPYCAPRYYGYRHYGGYRHYR